MKNLSSPISRCLLRHLSTTVTTAATTTAPITIHETKQNLPNQTKAFEIFSSVTNPVISPFSSNKARQFTVQRLADAHRFADIETLIESLKNHPNITKESYFCNLIRCYGKAGMFDHAIKLYDQMEELGTPRSCSSFNALLVAGNDCRVFDRVRQLFDEMPERYGFVPNVISYGILVQSYCLEGEPEIGLNFIEEIEGKGVQVTLPMFTPVIDAFYKKGKVDEAERVWGVMVEKGCVPNVAAWNIKICHAQNGDPEGVKKLIDEMEAALLKPNVTSYSYLLACYCRNDRLCDAMKLYDYLEECKLRPKAAIFTTLISYLCKIEDYGKGYDLFRRSANHNKILDFETLKVLVQGLVKTNMVLQAKDLIWIAKQQFPDTFMNAWNKLELDLGLV